MTTFVEMYHPALPGIPHVRAATQAVPEYEARGWIVVDGTTPAPEAIYLTPGIGDLRYAKLGDIPTSGTATGDALRAAFGLSVASTASANATLAANKHTPVDATVAARTMTLPTGQAEGTRIIVEKFDSSPNTVTLSGSIRGSAGTLTLAGQFETLALIADSSGSWHPVAGHKTKTWLDSKYGAAALAADPTMKAAFTQVGEMGTSVGRYATGTGDETSQIQSALTAAPSGGLVHFPAPSSGSGYYTISNSLTAKSGQKITCAPGVEIRQGTWQKPVFDLIDVNDVLIQGFKLTYTGTKTTSGAAIRGENWYNQNAAIWTNGNRNRMVDLDITGFSLGIDFAAWNSTSGAITSALRVDNSVENVRVTGADFGVLWLCQQRLRINNLSTLNHVDSSSGANPIHTFYGTGSNTLRSADVQVTNAICDGNPFGAAFQAKYVDGFTFRGGIAERCTALLNIVDGSDIHCSDLIYRNGVGTDFGILYSQESTLRPQRLQIDNVTIMATNTDTTTPKQAVTIVADNFVLDQITVITQRTAVNDGYDVYVRGNGGTVTGLTVLNLGSEGRTLSLGSGSGPVTNVTVRGLRTSGSRQLIDVLRASTGVLLDVDPANQQATGSWPNGGIGATGTGAEPEITFTGRQATGAGGRVNSYYGPAAISLTTTAIAADVIRAAPLALARSVGIDQITAEVTVAAASSTVRMGIYASGFDGYPSRLVYDAGTVDSSTTGVKTVTVSGVTLQPGLYWLAAVSTGGAPTVRTIAPVPHPAVAPVAASTTAIPSTYTAALTAGAALPATFPTSVATSTFAHYVQVRTQKPS